MRLPAAVLFDMDGTLVDTEPLWMAAEHELALHHGRRWTDDDGRRLIGNDLRFAADYIRDRLSLLLSPEQIIEALVSNVTASLTAASTVWRPGAISLLVSCNRARVPTALVTMSYRRMADAVVAALPSGHFDAIVAGDEVQNGKPHPEPYAQAAALLGVDPRDCVAIEDSPAGATSAEAAGCYVLVVAHLVDVPLTPRRTARASLVGESPVTMSRYLGPRAPTEAS